MGRYGTERHTKVNGQEQASSTRLTSVRAAKKTNFPKRLRRLLALLVHLLWLARATLCHGGRAIDCSTGIPSRSPVRPELNMAVCAICFSKRIQIAKVYRWLQVVDDVHYHKALLPLFRKTEVAT